MFISKQGTNCTFSKDNGLKTLVPRCKCWRILSVFSSLKFWWQSIQTDSHKTDVYFPRWEYRWVWLFYNSSIQGCTHSLRQVAVATEFGTGPPNICGSYVCNLYHETVVVPRILRWRRDFWGEIYAPVHLSISARVLDSDQHVLVRANKWWLCNDFVTEKFFSLGFSARWCKTLLELSIEMPSVCNFGLWLCKTESWNRLAIIMNWREWPGRTMLVWLLKRFNGRKRSILWTGESVGSCMTDWYRCRMWGEYRKRKT